MFRSKRIAFTFCFCIVASQAVRAEEDPLLKALQDLQADVEKLRKDIRSPSGKPASPPAMSGPAMSAPAMSAPKISPPSRAATNTSRASSPTPTKYTNADLAPAKLAPASSKSTHWSFQPVSKPTLPAVQNSAWIKDDMDRFILARLEKAGIQPNADAQRAALLRRVALDITGLPPTTAQTEAFVKDPASDDQALTKAVDHFLKSPRFGERWGRHWLDIARYADSVGRTWNAPFTYAWRYRDYVIDAFNNDRPYNRFILQQLAGDLLPANSVEERRDNLTATGFLSLGAMSLNDGRLEGFYLDRVDEQIDVTSRAFLGLTISCARCHDHKYDPISMRDYYAVAGIFYSTETRSGQGHQGEQGRGGYVDPDRLLRLPSLSGRRSPGELVDGVHSMYDYQDVARSGQRDIRFATDPDLAMGVTDGEPRDCEIRIKGDAYERGDAPPRGDLRIPGLPLIPAISHDDSGRLELAQWFASPDHPLTARVLTNRVWQHLFGRGLVRTVDDFGSTGERPSNPELLDHLASRFMHEGWSVKRLIRTIVLSRTYRESSAGQAAAKEKDPANELHWRMEPRRLELESIRDNLLYAAGRLQFERPDGIQVAGIGGKGKNGQVRSLLSLDSSYRTVYLPVLRAFVPELYDTFDFSDPCQLNGQRQVTTVAPQALFFMNGPLVIDCATDAARKLLEAPQLDNAGRVKQAYLKIVSRSPDTAEVNAALQMMRDLEADGARDPELYRWATWVQALFASAEFRYAL